MGEGDTTGSLTNGVQTATTVTILPPGHEVIPGKTFKNCPFMYMNTNNNRCTQIILCQKQ